MGWEERAKEHRGKDVKGKRKGQEGGEKTGDGRELEITGRRM